MAQTTGQISAKDVKLTLSTTDISGSSNKIEIKPKLDAGRTATFDGSWKIATSGKFEFDITMDVVYTETGSEAMDKIWTAFIAGAAVAFTASPKGGSVGEWEFSGNIIITDAPISLDGKSGDPVLVTVNAIGSGTLTKAAVAST